VRVVTKRGIALVLLTLSAPVACQLFEEKPAATPSEPQPERVIAPRGPLPPEEQPPPEVPATEAPPAEAKPIEPGITSTGAPTRGKLPPAVVDEKLKAAQPGIGACYEAGLQTKPDLRGTVNINFVVATDGKVAHAEALEVDGALPDSATVACILGVIKKLEFPAPSGGRVFLNYPLQLEPPK
jgi:hypothetical protein